MIDSFLHRLQKKKLFGYWKCYDNKTIIEHYFLWRKFGAPLNIKMKRTEIFSKLYRTTLHNFVVPPTEYSVSNFIAAFASDLLSRATCSSNRETLFLGYLVLEPDPYTK